MIRSNKDGLLIYSWASLDRLGVKAFSAAGLNMALHAPGKMSPREILNNRSLLSRSCSVNSNEWICANQVHSANAAAVSSSHRGRGALSAADALDNTDALILTETGLQAMIFTADCLPVILYDRKQKVGALIHAGWRGAASGIVINTLKKMIDETGCHRDDILVAAGPAIESCCYQVDGPVFNKMTYLFPETETAFTPDGKDHWRFSLEKAVFNQLLSRGIKEKQCEGSGLCSCCTEELSSWRREGAEAGRMATCLCL